MTAFYVALGGALGALARWTLLQVVSAPLGTVVVNVLGSFLIGFAFVLSVDFGPKWQPFVLTGLLGGFTTFSAFSLDTLKLFEAGRIWAAAFYAFGSVTLSIVAIAVSVMLVRSYLS